MSLGAIVALLIIAVIVLPPLMAGSTLKELGDGQRAGLAGEFVQLSDGVVHYTLEGPVDGEVVVLVHGFATPAFVWRQTASALAAGGFRVVAYDHFGRGLSDRPRVNYDVDLFDRQLEGLIRELGPRVPVNLVGYSMGGAIATVFAGRHPRLVKRVVLVAPAGYSAHLPASARLMRLPLLGDWLMAVLGRRSMLKVLGRQASEPGAPADFAERFKEQMEYRGFLRALASTLRHYPLDDLAWAYEKLGLLDKPVLLVWGEEDEIVPFEGSRRLLAAVPSAEFHAVAGARHSLPFTRPHVLNPLLAAFLGR
ncbi:MAG: alpha/beta fold hydrolase [Candidatus Binatia bacterium]